MAGFKETVKALTILEQSGVTSPVATPPARKLTVVAIQTDSQAENGRMKLVPLPRPTATTTTTTTMATTTTTTAS